MGKTILEACIPLLERYLVIRVDISQFFQSIVFIMGHTYFADGGFYDHRHRPRYSLVDMLRCES